MLEPIANPNILHKTKGHFSTSWQVDMNVDELIEWSALSIPDQMSKAVAKRKIEYLAGRYCAQQAMKKCGFKETAVVGLNKEDRAPVWPKGIIGSITHTGGFVSAVADFASHIRGVGIDTEKIITQKSEASLERMVLNPPEFELAETLCPEVISQHEFYTLVFSAKESIYKCLYPLVGRFFGFKDANIVMVDLSKRCWQFQLTTHLHQNFPKGFEGIGKFALDSNLVHTAFELL